MIEPKELIAARSHLARAEQSLRNADGIVHLEEGLALLQDVARREDSHAGVAWNLARTYTARIYGAVDELIQRDRHLPEPDLEHILRLILTIDEGGFEVPPNANELKVRIGQRLLERYLEGHETQEKQAALRELLSLLPGRSKRSARTSNR